MARSLNWLSMILLALAWGHGAVGAEEPAADAADKPPVAAAAKAEASASESASASSSAVAITTEAAKSGPTDEQIQGWIKDMDSEKFATREQASQRLLGAGAAGVDALAAAVDNKSREVSMRAMQIIEQLHRTGSATTQQKTRAALEKIATKSESVAAQQKAADILKPQPDPALAGQVIIGGGGVGGPFGNRIQINGGGVVANVQIVGGIVGPNGNVKFQMQNINGRRTVDATENDRKIHIDDDPQNGIDIKVTEKVDGKEKITKYAAKNLDELKKNHPEGAKLYQKYAGNALGNAANAANAAIQMQVQGRNIAIPGGVIPGFQAPQPNFAPPVAPPAGAQLAPVAAKGAADEIGAARKLLADAKLQVAKAAEGKNDAGLQKALEQLKAADERLVEAESKLP